MTRSAPLRVFLCFVACGCGATPEPPAVGDSSAADTEAMEAGEADIPVRDNGTDTNAEASQDADVVRVASTGSPGAYSFSVTLLSPDTGCEQYADWWEVLSADSALLYRRILAHSHAGEEPFTRSGGPVDAQANDRLFIRGHMNNSGYGGAVFQGSVADGFVATDSLPAPTDAVENADPQPSDCAF